MTSHSGTPPRKSPPRPEINRPLPMLCPPKSDPAPDCCPQATGTSNAAKNKTTNFLPNFSIHKPQTRQAKRQSTPLQRPNPTPILQQYQSDWQTFIPQRRANQSLEKPRQIENSALNAKANSLPQPRRLLTQTPHLPRVILRPQTAPMNRRLFYRAFPPNPRPQSPRQRL